MYSHPGKAPFGGIVGALHQSELEVAFCTGAGGATGVVAETYIKL